MSTRSLPSEFRFAREFRESRQLIPHTLDDPAHKIMLCRYHVDANHWGEGRLSPPMLKGTRHPDIPELLCVVPDTPETQIDDLLFFTRVFANIPRSFTESSASVIRLPGIQQAETFETGQTITAAVQSSFTGIWTLTVATHGLSAGDNTHISLRVSWPSHLSPWGSAFGGFPITDTRGFFGSYTILSTTTNTLAVKLGVVPGALATTPITIISGTVREISAGFQPRPVATRLVSTEIQRDYFIPGISAEAPTRTAIPLFQPFTIEIGSEDPDTFPEFTVGAGTVPTATQYRAMMDANSALILDSSLEPYLGPILCRKTTTFIAT